MADPRAVVPYHGPHDSPYNTDYIHNLSHIVSSPIPPSPLLYDIDAIDPNDTFDAQIVFDDNDACNNVKYQEGTSTAHVIEESSNNNKKKNNNNNLHADNNNSVLPLSNLPLQQQETRNPYSCCFCHVLREIVHVNEMTNFVTKLEVHGHVGLIRHAILHEGMNGAPHQYQIFDFCKKSLEDVKFFLLDYFNKRKEAGYTMLLDPLSFFYEALCVGLDFYEVMTFDQDFFQSSPIHSAGVAKRMNQTQAESQTSEGILKSSLSIQRQRTGKLTLKDLESYFDLPIEEAGRLLNLCPTVIKKVCRKHDLRRWPYRKIKSLKRQIANWSDSLKTDVSQDRAHAEAEIRRLQQELSNIYSPLS